MEIDMEKLVRQLPITDRPNTVLWSRALSRSLERPLPNICGEVPDFLRKWNRIRGASVGSDKRKYVDLYVPEPGTRASLFSGRPPLS